MFEKVQPSQFYKILHPKAQSLLLKLISSSYSWYNFNTKSSFKNKTDKKIHLQDLKNNMKIQSVLNTFAPARSKIKNNNYTVKPDNSSRNININTLPNTYNDISFGKSLSYNDFLASMHAVYKNKSLKNVILSTIGNDKNFIGRGFSANVYSMQGIDNYLIRVERKHFSPKSFIENPIIAEHQNELAPNFGQYVASNGHGLFITKKVFGESHSLPNWSLKIIGIEKGVDEITHKDAKFISNKVKILSEFPQAGFNDLSRKIQQLNKYTDCEIDIMNPNNLIVDEGNTALGIIDLWYKHSENDSTAPFNGIDSIINLMLDPLTHNKVYEKLNNADKELFTNSSEQIIKKVFTAGEKFGLERTNDNAAIIYKDFDKNAGLDFAVPAYEEFLNMYKHLL